MAADNTMSLNEQAQEILRIAQENGVEQNFFFVTTFKRYQVQMNILTNLEETINKDGTLVNKEYVKGRKNIYTHPAIGEYNKTATAANQTVQTIIKIIQSLRKDTDKDGNNPHDKLLDFLSGHRGPGKGK